MRQTFSFSPLRCALYSAGGWLMLGLAAYMWLTWRQPDTLAHAMTALIAFIGVSGGIMFAYLMYTDYPIYILNERGLIVRQTHKTHLHYRVNWSDIENIRITGGKHPQLMLKIKDGSKHYFHAKGRAAYAKQKLKFNRTTEILAMANMVEGGRRGLYRTLTEYWQYYRH